jgi:hypothetical protein
MYKKRRAKKNEYYGLSVYTGCGNHLNFVKTRIWKPPGIDRTQNYWLKILPAA